MVRAEWATKRVEMRRKVAEEAGSYLDPAQCAMESVRGEGNWESHGPVSVV